MHTFQNEDVFTTWTTEYDEEATTLVYMCGELDASTAPSLLSDLRGLTERDRHLILDVHLLSYIDSTGVAAIMSIKSLLGSLGKKLYLVGCHGLLTKILQVTRFDKELPCMPDIDSALADLRAA